MDAEENQKQVSLRRPPPLEIAARFPHSHSPGDESYVSLKAKPGPDGERFAPPQLLREMAAGGKAFYPR